MSNLVKAIELACKVHASQMDKGGQPYILHPLRLMLKFADESERIAAVLHDVIEDGDVSLSDLRGMGFSAIVLDAIDCLTKRHGENYDDFLCRVISNRLATKIKIEDIKDNLDLTRIGKIEDSDVHRIKKYHFALNRLLSA